MVTIDVGKLKQCLFWVERAYMVAMITLWSFYPTARPTILLHSLRDASRLTVQVHIFEFLHRIFEDHPNYGRMMESLNYNLGHLLFVMEKIGILMCLLNPSAWSIVMSIFVVTNVLYMFSGLLAMQQAPDEKMKVEEEEEEKVEEKEEVKEVNEERKCEQCEKNAMKLKQEFKERLKLDRSELLEKMKYCCTVYDKEVDGLTEENRRLSEALEQNKQQCINILEKMNYCEILGKMKYYEECCAVYVDHLYDLTEKNRRLWETAEHFKEQLHHMSNNQSSSNSCEEEEEYIKV